MSFSLEIISIMKEKKKRDGEFVWCVWVLCLQPEEIHQEQGEELKKGYCKLPEIVIFILLLGLFDKLILK